MFNKDNTYAWIWSSTILNHQSQKN